MIYINQLNYIINSDGFNQVLKTRFSIKKIDNNLIILKIKGTLASYYYNFIY
jgi:hypothetical protein